MQFNIHKCFRLNGHSFSSDSDLVHFGNSISKEIGTFLASFLDSNTTLELYTSGSTGTPKSIEIRKEYMVNSAKATGTFFELNESTKALLCMSAGYVGGKMMLVRAMVLGWQLDVVEPSKNPLKNVSKEYDFSAMVPLQVASSLEDLHKVKQLIIGGGAVSNELLKKLQSASTECFATYGMTETVSHIAIKKLNHHSQLKRGDKKQPIFKVLPNIIISADQRNCLVIDAPKLSDEKIITNDVVELISSTDFKWFGRFDTIINSGGVKLIPEQIENKLNKIISQRFFVSSVLDEILGEKLILIVEGKGDSSVILAGVKNLKSLSKYETPKQVYFVSNFVDTETKKIQRKKTLDLINL